MRCPPVGEGSCPRLTQGRNGLVSRRDLLPLSKQPNVPFPLTRVSSLPVLKLPSSGESHRLRNKGELQYLSGPVQRLYWRFSHRGLGEGHSPHACPDLYRYKPLSTRRNIEGNRSAFHRWGDAHTFETPPHRNIELRRFPTRILPRRSAPKGPRPRRHL
jgi:hypothetical protein